MFPFIFLVVVFDFVFVACLRLEHPQHCVHFTRGGVAPANDLAALIGVYGITSHTA